MQCLSCLIDVQAIDMEVLVPLNEMECELQQVERGLRCAQ
jgi:hypothetical protein